MDPITGIAAPPVSQSHHLSGAPQSRWAHIVAAVVTADEDVATLDAWAARVHMNQRTLCHRCRAARAPAKASLTLARLLRTLTVGDPRAWRPEDTLSVVDPRTIDRIVSAAGLQGFRGQPRPPAAALLTDPHSVIPLSARLTLGRVLGVNALSVDPTEARCQTAADAAAEAPVAGRCARICVGSCLAPRHRRRDTSAR
jgi:hypothetical protein